MDRYRLFDTLIMLCLGLAAASLLVHYVADAACVILENPHSTVCIAGTNATELNPGNTAQMTSNLHAGFALPATLPVLELPVLIATVITFSLLLSSYTPPPLRLPPR